MEGGKESQEEGYILGECVISSLMSRHSKNLKQWMDHCFIGKQHLAQFYWQAKENSHWITLLEQGEGQNYVEEPLEFLLLINYCSCAKKWKGEKEKIAVISVLCIIVNCLSSLSLSLLLGTQKKQHSNGASKKSSFLATWKLTLPYVK